MELEQQNPTEERVHEQEQVSTTDPDSTYATKGGTPARLGYYDHYLSPPGNAREMWQTRLASRTHSGTERRWKRGSRNSRIRSDFVVYACGD